MSTEHVLGGRMACQAKYIGAVSSGSIRGCSRDCQPEHGCGSFRDFGGLAEIMRGGAREGLTRAAPGGEVGKVSATLAILNVTTGPL